MLLNDIQSDVKKLMTPQYRSFTKLSAALGYSKQNLSRIFNARPINQTFIKLVEGLGYDIEFEYVKREDSNHAVE